ncbi:MAG: NADP(H)-dependent aldo-keto reductase [Candidatus Methylopumilus sp.]|nr:NADP(H)-dependent aldo-keto reductase [Candidatus Methylopumilus sp.]
MGYYIEKQQYRRLGQSDLLIAPITLGTMTFGEQNTESEAFLQLDWATSHGINFIDTAEMYPVPPKESTFTVTETILGNWLKKQKREEIVLATKAAGPRRSLNWIRNGPRAFDEKNLRAAVEGSLKRLQTDYIDLYQLHWPERNVPMFGQYKFDPSAEMEGSKLKEWVSIDDQLEALSKLVQEGKIKYIGISNEQSWGVMEFIRIAREKDLPLISSVQNCYNLINRGLEFGMTEILYREKIGFLAYSPLAFGHLTGKYLKDIDAKGRATLFKGFAQRYDKPSVFPAVKAYEVLASKHDMTLTEMALAFVYHQWFVTSTIVGATSLDQLKENIEAYNRSLSKDLLDDIESIHLTHMNPAP